MPHELFLKTRLKTKIKNAFENNISMDLSFSKYQFSKLIQSGRLLSKILGNLSKNVLLDSALPLGKDVLPKLVTKATLSVIDKSEKNSVCYKSRKSIHFTNLKWRYRWYY